MHFKLFLIKRFYHRLLKIILGEEIIWRMFSKTIQRSLTTTAKLSTSINKVVVIGAGAMGSGIAQVSWYIRL